MQVEVLVRRLYCTVLGVCRQSHSLPGWVGGGMLELGHLGRAGRGSNAHQEKFVWKLPCVFRFDQEEMVRGCGVAARGRGC